MSQRKPSLKLRLSTNSAPKESPTPETEASTPGPKLKLKFGGARTPGPSTTPDAPSSAKTKTKTDAKPKPTADDAKPAKPAKAPRLKIKAPIQTKKRQHDNTEPAPTKIKRLRLNTKPKPAPQLKFKKPKGEPPRRPLGVGYDSEASDNEVDPALEEQFILRMQPGEDCEYIRTAIEEKKWGPRSQGGADISFKPLTRDGRRATVTIRGTIYAASLVDLPCIIEGMKSWDRRGWFKSADVCQMLLVLGKAQNEAEALEYPLPQEVDPSTWQYAHGLTPPMRYARKRRFRKRISHRTIEAVELEVARLLKADQEAAQPPAFEVMDYASWTREQQMEEEEEEEEEEYEEYDEEQDAEGEAEYYEQAADEGFDDALAAEMEAALAAHADANATVTAPQDTPATQAPPTGGAEEVDDLFEAGTPQTRLGETSGDEDDESEESSPEDEEELDEDVLEEQRQQQQLREDVAELESLVSTETQRWQQMHNPILKTKLKNRVQELKQALSLKRVALGEEPE